MLRTTRGDVLILLAAAIWGVAFYFQKTAMDHIGPLLFTGLRGLMAFAVLLPFALLELRAAKESPTGHRVQVFRLACFGRMLFFVAGFIQQTGISSTSVTHTGLLTALYVVVVPFVFWIWRGQRPSGWVWLESVLAMLGIVGLGGGGFGDLGPGDALVALSAVFWGTLIVVAGRSGELNHPLLYTTAQFGVVAVLGLTSALLFETVDLSAVWAASESLLYVGVLSTAMTFGIMSVALRDVAPPRAAILLASEVPFSAAAGYLLLGERLSLIGLAGAGLIIVAILIVRARDT